MKTFKVKIIERCERIVEIEAESMMEALLQVEKDYDDGKILLNRSDFKEGFQEIMVCE